jgi:hypothetical protein
LSGGEGKKQGKIPWTEAPPAKEKGSAREKIKQRERKNRGEREMELPKDLCANSENYKGLSVKHKFSIDLKP